VISDAIFLNFLWYGRWQAIVTESRANAAGATTAAPAKTVSVSSNRESVGIVLQERAKVRDARTEPQRIPYGIAYLPYTHTWKPVAV